MKTLGTQCPTSTHPAKKKKLLHARHAYVSPLLQVCLDISMFDTVIF